MLMLIYTDMEGNEIKEDDGFVNVEDVEKSTSKTDEAMVNEDDSTKIKSSTVVDFSQVELEPGN